MEGLSDKSLLDFINDLINSNASKINEQNKYMTYYLGENDVDKKTDDLNKPNNILKFNFAELVIETNHSYLFSNPISYDSKDNPAAKKFIDYLRVINHDNDEEFHTASIGKSAAIRGEAVEIVNIDPQGNIQLIETPSTEWVFFNFNNKEYALRHYEVERWVPQGNSYEKKDITKVEIYSDTQIERYEIIEDNLYIEQGYPKPHYFEQIPVVVYENKSTNEIGGQSDIKNIVNLIDGYNKAMSAIADTIEYNSDPYLVLINLGLTAGLSEEEAREEVDRMRKARLLEFTSDSQTQADAKFLQWDNNIEAYELFLNRLVRKIFILSFTPDLFTKEGQITADSGIALQIKHSGTDIKSNAKIKAFVKGLRKRLKLIAIALEKQGLGDFYSSGAYRDVNISFNKSMPVNISDEIETAVKALGVLSHRTVIEKFISKVDNAEEELKRIEEEQGTPINLGEPTMEDPNGE
ncbi:phage portal protein [Tuberibacillus calidus]|jgi:SPP1 family phage portal protein|uniref:phage portal protein n=1 Tax=Tuberibacillus calidus TaxID=340097 RepID=UPI0003F61B1F|nr:phage portal protein [Tuberibacillus calidus]